MKRLRKSKNLTQAEMAEELGLKHSSGYAKIERGGNTSVKRIYQIAKILEVNPYELFKDKKMETVQEDKSSYGPLTKNDLTEWSFQFYIRMDQLSAQIEKLNERLTKLAKR